MCPSLSFLCLSFLKVRMLKVKFGGGLANTDLFFDDKSRLLSGRPVSLFGSLPLIIIFMISLALFVCHGPGIDLAKKSKRSSGFLTDFLRVVFCRPF